MFYDERFRRICDLGKPPVPEPSPPPPKPWPEPAPAPEPCKKWATDKEMLAALQHAQQVHLTATEVRMREKQLRHAERYSAGEAKLADLVQLGQAFTTAKAIADRPDIFKARCIGLPANLVKADVEVFEIPPGPIYRVQDAPLPPLAPPAPHHEVGFGPPKPPLGPRPKLKTQRYLDPAPLSRAIAACDNQRDSVGPPRFIPASCRPDSSP